MKSESESRSVVSNSLRVHGLWNSPGQNTGVNSRSHLQGIFPTQELNPDLPPCRQILYQLSHQGSPRILEWVVYPFSSRSCQPTNWTGVSCIAGGFFTNWAIREAQHITYSGIYHLSSWLDAQHPCLDCKRSGSSLAPLVLIAKELWSLGKFSPSTVSSPHLFIFPPQLTFSSFY